MASSVGISYIVVVQSRLTQGKCLKDGRGVTLRVVLGDLLGNLPGEKEGTKIMKIGIVSRKKIGLVLKKGRIKLTGQCRVLQGMGDLIRETRNLSTYVGW